MSFPTPAGYTELDLNWTSTSTPTTNATNATNATNTTNTTTLTGEKLVFARTGGLPYVYSLNVSFYDILCLDPTVAPVSKTMGGYPLSAADEVGCLRYGNLDNSIHVDNEPIATTFLQNNLNSTTSTLPWYPLYYANQTAFLIGLLQFSINPNLVPCQNMNVTNLNNIIVYEGDYDYIVVALSMTALAITGSMIATLGAEFRLRYLFDEEDNKVLFITVLNLVFYLALATVYMTQGGYIMMKSTANFIPYATYFNTISTLNCFADYTVNIAFRDFYRHMDQNFNSVNYYAEVLMVFSAVSVIVWFFALVARGILEISKRRNGDMDPVNTEEYEEKSRKPTQTGIEMLFTDKA